jgi:hypothetical protein
VGLLYGFELKTGLVHMDKRIHWLLSLVSIYGRNGCKDWVAIFLISRNTTLWFICGTYTGINYYKLAVEKDRDSIFTTIIYIYFLFSFAN